MRSSFHPLGSGVAHLWDPASADYPPEGGPHMSSGIVSPGVRPQNWRMAADAARSFRIAAPGVGEIRTEPLDTPSQDDVVVRALYSGISRGTEALVFQGRVPPSEFQRMRAPFQSGSFPAPIKYGYAS